MTEITFDKHASITGFAVVDDRLTVGGRSVEELARLAGKTPFYAYDRRLLDERVAQWRTAMPDDLRLHYAVKANPMPALVDFMASRVDGLDVASACELRVALQSGMSPSRISFAGPGKTDAELSRAIAAGITVNVESVNELRRIATLAGKIGDRPSVAVRVNPDFMLKASGMKMGGGPQQFGIDAEVVPAVFAEMKTMPVEFAGLHIFAGSQNLRAEAISETQRKTFELARRLARDAPGPIRKLNIGGGMGIPYFPGEQPLDAGAVGRELGPLLDAFRAEYPGTRVIMELGRYLVGEAGIYVCRIIDRKVSRGRTYLVTDGGLHHHLAASGNFGQVIRKNYPVIVGNRVRGDTRETVTVVGPLCTPLDLLADQMTMAYADAGDLIVVFQSGAYGLTASPLGFLSHPAPAELLV